MQAIGIGKADGSLDCPRKKGTEPFYKWYKEQYKQYNDDEIEIPIQAMTKDEQQDPIRTTWCREERNKTVTEVSFKCEYCGKTFVLRVICGTHM